MTETTLSLSTAAKDLSPAGRVDLVDQILESLDKADPASDAAWATEADDRLAAYRRGEIRALSLAEVLAKYRTA
ncbi:MAG: addiction module protein [Stagnimonas sp.]|nr:addiction module protein [Stagnimonas sp.]